MTGRSGPPTGPPWGPHRGPGRWWPPSERPDWWPAEEAWPPVRRRRPWRRFGCLFAAVFATGVLGLLALGASFVAVVLAAPGVAGTVIRVASAVVVIGVIVLVWRTGRTIRGTATVLDELGEQAARVEAGDYAARVEVDGPAPRPVRNLVRGFNTMATRLEADEAQRRRLLADVTHELRTPLAIVQGNLEAILDGVHPPDRSHLETILDETRVLGRLVEDLRTLALSETGSLSLHRESTDLDVLCADVAASFEAAAETAGVTIETTVAQDVPALDVDPVRIREVIANVVGNALRHTPSGGRIAIQASLVAAAGRAEPQDIEIVVRDTGSGIDAELLPQVFDRFARDAGSSGTGLGLSIARGLVELHGGTITATSPPHGGTEIRILLPSRPA